MVQIRVYDDFTKALTCKVEVQEMSAYKVLFNETISRNDLDATLDNLFKKYPEYQLLTFKI